MKRFFTICFLLCVIGGLQAQDLHFSQYYNSPLTINPALTGKENAEYRVNANYRNQWFTLDNSKPIYTAAASIDGRILGDVLPKYDQLGIGIQTFFDRAGDGLYTNSAILPSIAYHKSLGYNHKIAAGLQAGLGAKSIDFSQLNFENQYIGIGFDRSLPIGEPFNTDQFNHFELGGGVYYSYRDNNDKWNAYAGGALFHINQPNSSFFNEDISLARRNVMQGGLTYFADNGMVVSPSALYMTQAGAKELTIGTIVGKSIDNPYSGYANSSSKAVYGGLFWREGDAIIGKAGMQFNNMQIGFSGDFNNSDIKQALGLNSAFELSLTWLGLADKDAKPIFCPSH